MGWQEELRAARAATDRAIKQRTAELQHFAEKAEARGREVYERAIKTGERVWARTPSEIRELGIATIRGKLPQALGEAAGKAAIKTVVKPTAPPARKSSSGGADRKTGRQVSIADQVVQQGGAAVRGAIDEATFGLADQGSAAIQALASGSADNFGERYSREIAEERAADAYDEQNYGLARGAGRVVGFVGSLAATGGAGAAAKAGAKVLGMAPALAKASEAANYTKRIAELSRVGLTPLALGGGAVAGVGAQALTDAVTGRRSGVGDYAGAALGGSTAALLLRAPKLGGGKAAEGLYRVVQAPMTAGGIEGAATTAYQGAFEGRDVDLGDIAQAARAGAIGGRIGDIAGKYGSNAASRTFKEGLGDNLSIMRSLAAGEGLELVAHLGPKRAPWREVKRRQVRVDLPGGGYTWADHVTPSDVVKEAKFGRHAHLSKRQKQATHQLPAGSYEVDHWLPSDVGRMVGLFGAGVGNTWLGED